MWKIPGFDKLAHAGFYFILSFLIFLPKSPARFEQLVFTKFVLTVLIVFGASLELLQYFVPYRTFDLVDIIANSLGIVLGMVFAKYLKNKGIFHF